MCQIRCPTTAHTDSVARELLLVTPRPGCQLVCMGGKVSLGPEAARVYSTHDDIPVTLEVADKRRDMNQTRAADKSCLS